MCATTKLGRRSNSRIGRRGLYSLVALVALAIGQAQAGAIAINGFTYGYSGAAALIWTPNIAPSWMWDSHSDGFRFGSTHASASLTHPVTHAFAASSASTSGWFGVQAHATGFHSNFNTFAVVAADLLDPFEQPVEPEPDKPASADLNCDGTLTDTTLVLSGQGQTNVNGYLELAVLDMRDLDPDEVAAMLMDLGSVEKAVAEGLFPAEQVLGHYREDQLAGTFTITVDVTTVPDDRIFVTGVAHGIATTSGQD
jgi:hypothetical protein